MTLRHEKKHDDDNDYDQRWRVSSFPKNDLIILMEEGGDDKCFQYS